MLWGRKVCLFLFFALCMAAISFSRIKRILKTYIFCLFFLLITTKWKYHAFENENECYGTRVGYWTLQTEWIQNVRAISRNRIELIVWIFSFHSFFFYYSLAPVCCCNNVFFFLLQTHVDWMAFGLYSFSVLYGKRWCACRMYKNFMFK